jgi:hypothetical protein
MSEIGATYFIKVYGSQRLGNRPKYSHTFATFTEVQIAADRSEQRHQFTISWLPQDGEIKPLGGPEPGRNYTLGETLAWLDENGSKDRWESPETAIQARLFESAVLRFNELTRAALLYLMIDSFLVRPHQASNCIHAVTDLPLALQNLGMCYTGVLHGISASRFVYQYLSPFYLKPPETTAATGWSFEQAERRHFIIAAAVESLVDAYTIREGEIEASRSGRVG